MHRLVGALQQRSNATAADLEASVCYHSGTYPFSVIHISVGSFFYRRLFPPSFYPFAYILHLFRLDSESRSLVRCWIRDGWSRQGPDLRENCHAILMTVIHAVKCQTCKVPALRRGPLTSNTVSVWTVLMKHLSHSQFLIVKHLDLD